MGTSAGAERTRQFNLIENIVLRKEIKRLNRLISLRKLMFLLIQHKSGAGSEREARYPALPKTLFCATFRAPQNRLTMDLLEHQGMVWNRRPSPRRVGRSSETL